MKGSAKGFTFNFLASYEAALKEVNYDIERGSWYLRPDDGTKLWQLHEPTITNPLDDSTPQDHP